jgi:hypothetical protein
MTDALLVIWLNFATIKCSGYSKNCDMKLSTENYYFIINFISILDNMLELETI